MSKYIVDDPWLEYLYLPGKRSTELLSDKQRRALGKRIARFRRSRKTKPLRKF